MNTPQPRSWPTHASVVLGLAFLGFGLVTSCASTPRPTQERSSTPDEPLPDVRDEPQTETIQPNEHDAKPAEEVQPPHNEGGSTEGGHVPNELDGLRSALEELRAKNQQQIEELRALYRRLHIELETPGRSALIVELFNDQRTEMRLLGFELADRDLSASKELGDVVGQAVRGLLKDKSPLIRARAARLITRMVPPDGMIVLTESMQTEDDPVAVEPMLLGIARWPNADARNAIMGWFVRDDAPLLALCGAGWAMEREGLLEQDTDYPVILTRLRAASPGSLREDGMKLLAKLGSAEDLRRLVDLMLSEDPSVVRWAATALVETPRAVEVLVRAAGDNEVLFQAAAEALIKHRATPEGMRRLAELPQSDANLRRQMLERIGQAIDREQLGEAVYLAQLGPELSISILSRLIANESEITPRSAKGVLQLAELQLDAGRPNRVNEALLALEGVTLDPPEKVRQETLRVQSLVLLGRFDEAIGVSSNWSHWKDALARAVDAGQRSRIAQFLLEHEGITLTEEQTRTLSALLVDEPDEQGDD